MPRHDLGREIVSPLIERQMLFENTPGPFGYPVLNGLNFNKEMIKVWSVAEGTEVVLSSDGYPELCGTLAQGCGYDAPGSFAAWLSRRVPMYAYMMPGMRHDIGNLESYEMTRKTYKGIILS